jgi:hypothetical protein
VVSRRVADSAIFDSTDVQPLPYYRVGQSSARAMPAHRGCRLSPVPALRPGRNCQPRRNRTLLTPFDRPTLVARSSKPRVVSRRQLVRAIAAAVTAHAPWGGLAAAVDAQVDLLPYQLEPALAIPCLATRVLR